MLSFPLSLTCMTSTTKPNRTKTVSHALYCNTTDATSVARHAYPSAAPEFISVLCVGFAYFTLIFCVVFCSSLFDFWSIFPVSIALSVLRLTATDYLQTFLNNILSY